MCCTGLPIYKRYHRGREQALQKILSLAHQTKFFKFAFRANSSCARLSDSIVGTY